MIPPQYPSEPAPLWQHFYRISRIPRPSGGEAAVRDYVIGTAAGAGRSWRMDATGNLVVYLPGSPGRELAAPVVVQNHLDMVTVKTADKAHDFHRDPLDLVVEDGWLRADRTTLGADNGIGCAAALALLTSNGLQHPPLELLFTVDEESGLNGALGLDASLLSGTRLLNLDTEDWQELFVGCAGAVGWELRRDGATSAPAPGHEHWQLSLSGLAGGHSGIQIHEQLGNAIKLLGQCLQDVDGLRLAHAAVGVAHNVIPREGSIGFTCAPGGGAALRARLDTLRDAALSWLPGADGGLRFELAEAAWDSALCADDSREVLDLVAALPHGALAYNPQLPGELVDLSCNLAVLQLSQGALLLECSCRFFNEAQSLPLRAGIAALARAFRLQLRATVGYPGWQPDFDSPLLARAMALHESLFGVAPRVKAIHAGLECGIVKSKKPELDILSFGPTIRGAHSPGESLQIDTVAPFWQFLTALLAQM